MDVTERSGLPSRRCPQTRPGTGLPPGLPWARPGPGSRRAGRSGPSQRHRMVRPSAPAGRQHRAARRWCRVSGIRSV